MEDYDNEQMREQYSELVETVENQQNTILSLSNRISFLEGAQSGKDEQLKELKQDLQREIAERLQIQTNYNNLQGYTQNLESQIQELQSIQANSQGTFYPNGAHSGQFQVIIHRT